MHPLLFLLICLACLLRSPAAHAQGCNDIGSFASERLPAREIHVSVSGSDERGDGSAAHPFATIQRAARDAQPGSAIRLLPGTYRGGVALEHLKGDELAPIWIGGAPGAEPRPVIEGGTTGIHLVGASCIVLHDLEIRDASGNGVNSDDAGRSDDEHAAHHQVFQRLRIHRIGSDGNQDGLKLSGVRRFWVLDCDISRCGGRMSGSGIDMVGCHNGVIARCTLHDLSANAVQAKGGTSDVLITRCRMERAGERALNIGGSTGLEFFRPPVRKDAPNAEARRITAAANVIIGGGCAVAFVGAVDCTFAHNTVIDPERWVLRILQEQRTSDLGAFEACGRNRVAANIFVFRRAQIRTHLNIGADTDAASFVFEQNCWFASDAPSGSKPSLPAPETDGMYAIDPLVQDAGPAGLRVLEGSPCIGAGRHPAPVKGDVHGACYQPRPSLGAVEP